MFPIPTRHQHHLHCCRHHHLQSLQMHSCFLRLIHPHQKHCRYHCLNPNSLERRHHRYQQACVFLQHHAFHCYCYLSKLRLCGRFHCLNALYLLPQHRECHRCRCPNQKHLEHHLYRYHKEFPKLQKEIFCNKILHQHL